MASKKKMSAEPLLCGQSEGWISQTPLDDEGKKKVKAYCFRFVSESEAIESSRLTNGFIADLTINTTVSATSFLAQMRLKNADISFRSFESPGDLAKALIEDGLASDDFFEHENEFAYICNSAVAPLSKRINNLREFKPGQKKKEGKKRQNKSEFRRLDAVLRHLRNAFAHGQFTRYKRNDGTCVWALQDANSKGRITARFMLEETTLDSWASLITARDKRYRDKKSKH